jgi:hypothetical protein
MAVLSVSSYSEAYDAYDAYDASAYFLSIESPVVECAPVAAAPTLEHLLLNQLIVTHLAPHLPVSSTLALATTSRTIRNALCHYPSAFRYLDLSTVKAVRHPTFIRGGASQTDEEYYAGPIRGIFAALENREWLLSVSTLILDGITVTADVVQEIVSGDKFNVRILSIREAKQMNMRKLNQVLRYACRPTRPHGTPRLRGLYVFGPKDPVPPKKESPGRRASPDRYRSPSPSEAVSAVGAQLGAEWNRKSQETLAAELHAHDDNKWYHSAGRLIGSTPIPEWAETLRVCEGVIHFDAVLCRGPRHSPNFDRDAGSYLPPAIATTALGPKGCDGCGGCPEGAASFGRSPSHHLPLLAPPPLYSSSIRAAQMPSSDIPYADPKLVVRCDECLKSRWCQRCHKWWCETCFQPGAATFTELQALELINEIVDAGPVGEFDAGLVVAAGEDRPFASGAIKVHMGFCLESCLVNDSSGP